MAEWLKAAVLKTVVALRLPGVRIPLSLLMSSKPAMSAGFFIRFIVHSFQIPRDRVKIRKLPRRLRRGVANTPCLRVGNPDALYRDFSPNYFKDILCFYTVSPDCERKSFSPSLSFKT